MQSNNFEEEGRVTKRKRPVLDIESDSASDLVIPHEEEIHQNRRTIKKFKQSEVAKRKLKKRIEKKVDYESDGYSDYEPEKNFYCSICDRECTLEHEIKHNGYDIERRAAQKQFRLKKERRLLRENQKKPIEYVIVHDDFSCDELYGVVTVFNTADNQHKTPPMNVNPPNVEMEDHDFSTVSDKAEGEQVLTPPMDGNHKEGLVDDKIPPINAEINEAMDVDFDSARTTNSFKTASKIDH